MAVKVVVRYGKARPTQTLGVVLTTFQFTLEAKGYGLSRPTYNLGLTHRGYGTASPIWGLPDTQPINPATQFEQGHVELNHDRQWYWYNINVDNIPGMPRDFYDRSFNGMTTDDRWQTNRYGSNTCAVYPTMKNLGKDDMRYFPLVTGTTILEIVGPAARVYGAMRFPFRVINASKNNYNITPKTDPFLFYRPMNSTRSPVLDANGKWLGYYREDLYKPFPQYAERSITPIWMPRGDVGWMEARFIRILSPFEPIPVQFN